MTDTTAAPPRPIVFLDTETTHLHPTIRRPWEIAMIRRPALPAVRGLGKSAVPGDGRITMMIANLDLSGADKGSLSIGRFDERHPSSGHDVVLDAATIYVSEAEAASIVERWTRHAIVIGLVPDFDVYTLDPMLRRHGLLPRQYYHCIDVETEAAGWLRGRLHAGDPGLVARCDEVLDAIRLPRKSDSLSRLCGVEPPGPEERHTAMGDASWNERWWDALTPVLGPTRGAVA